MDNIELNDDGQEGFRQIAMLVRSLEKAQALVVWRFSSVKE